LGLNPENRVDEESIHSPIRLVLPLQRSTCATAETAKSLASNERKLRATSG